MPAKKKQAIKVRAFARKIDGKGDEQSIQNSPRTYCFYEVKRELLEANSDILNNFKEYETSIEKKKAALETLLWKRSPIGKFILFTENPLFIVGDTEIWVDLDRVDKEVKEQFVESRKFTASDEKIMEKLKNDRKLEKVDAGLATGAGLLAGVSVLAYTQGADLWSWVQDDGLLAQKSTSSNLHKARAKILADRKARERQAAIDEDMSRKQGMLATRDFLGRPSNVPTKKPWIPGAVSATSAPEKRGFSMAFDKKPEERMVNSGTLSFSQAR